MEMGASHVGAILDVLWVLLAISLLGNVIACLALEAETAVNARNFSGVIQTLNAKRVTVTQEVYRPLSVIDPLDTAFVMKE